MKFNFVKMHGTGNDFVVLDGIRRKVRMTPRLAAALADRRFGVGADQILVLEKSRRADFAMRIYNADGSQVEMCGNGIRCVARFARREGIAKSNEMAVDTLAGVIRPKILGEVVRVDMGEPILDAARIPTRAKGRVLEKDFRIPGMRAKITCVSMGNPHAVIFVENVQSIPLDEWGPRIERHPFFPKRTNVEFVELTGPGSAQVRVWERGAGATLACGTGACAVVVAGVLTGRLRRSVRLELPGGELAVEWAGNNHVFLEGPAEFVYEGKTYV